jgi:hypothetical protein
MRRRNESSDLSDGDITELVAAAREKLVVNGIQISLGQTSMLDLESAVEAVKECLLLCQLDCADITDIIEQLIADRDSLVLQVALLCTITDKLSQRQQ